MKNNQNDISIDEFENLFRKEHVRLTHHACNLVRDPEVARDIVQEVFYKLWKTKDRVNFHDNISGYLFKATTNGALNYLKSPKRVLHVAVEKAVEKKTADHSDHLEYNELERSVRAAIDRLPSKCRVIYLLSRHEDMKNHEIAEHLDISVKTVENQMTIALKKLREFLEHYLIEFLVLLLALSYVIWSFLQGI